MRYCRNLARWISPIASEPAEKTTCESGYPGRDTRPLRSGITSRRRRVYGVATRIVEGE